MLNVTACFSSVADNVHPLMNNVPISWWLLTSGYCTMSQNSRHLELLSWTCVHCTQMASTVTRSQSLWDAAEWRFISRICGQKTEATLTSKVYTSGWWVYLAYKHEWNQRHFTKCQLFLLIILQKHNKQTSQETICHVQNPPPKLIFSVLLWVITKCSFLTGTKWSFKRATT